MAITKIENPQQAPEEELQLKFNNGDLKALEDARKKWKFIDIENLLKFALAVMLKAENNKLYIEQSGNKIGVAPADNLLEKNDSNEPKAE